MTCPHCHTPLALEVADDDLGGDACTMSYAPCPCPDAQIERLDAQREQAIRQRLAHRTPGEWRRSPEHDHIDLWQGGEWIETLFIGYACEDADEEFVVHAPSDLEWLLGSLEAARAQLHPLRAENERLRQERNAARVDARRETAAEVSRLQGLVNSLSQGDGGRVP
jgi:hypothetical protein